MGMKDINSIIQIVDGDEAQKIDKNKNVSVFSDLGNDKYLIRYSGKIPDNIRNFYKINEQEFNDSGHSIIDKKKKSKEWGFNKKLSVPSAVHIASAISAYARIIINEYKNIPGNPCCL